MGSPMEEPGRSADEVQHQVTLSTGFYLGKYEVTQEQWASVMDTKPWLDANSQLDDIIFSEMDVISQPNHPVVYVSWDDAQAFIDRLNQTVGKEIYRLPTEAEWEYAARAGTTTRWSFGESERLLGEYAWYAGNTWNVGKKHAQPVGMKRANPGVCTIYGNVWEWCQDKYGEYDPSESMDPQGPSEGLHRVMRGGGFSYDAQSRLFCTSRLRPRTTVLWFSLQFPRWSWLSPFESRMIVSLTTQDHSVRLPTRGRTVRKRPRIHLHQGRPALLAQQ